MHDRIARQVALLGGVLALMVVSELHLVRGDDGAQPSSAQSGAADGISFEFLDGTKITGKANVEQFAVETASGTVKVPFADLVSFTPGLESRPDLAKRVAALIAALSSDSFPERERAQRELTEMGPMLRMIVAEHANDADAERQHRVAQILKAYETWAAQHPEAPSSSTTPISRQDTIQTSSAKYVGRITQKQFRLETAYGTFKFELGQVVEANKAGIVPAQKAEKGTCPVAVKLRDGSYVKGQLEPLDIEVHGPYGDACIPITLLLQVTAQDDAKHVDVILKGGDHLRGSVDWSGKLALKTVSGTRVISPEEIAHIGVGAAAVVPFEIATNSIGMKLSLIPAGSFLMGSPSNEEGRIANEQQHRVRITRPFFMGVYPVTQAEYEQFMGNNPSSFASTGSGKDKVAGQDTRRFPVEQVSWVEAQEFCRKLSQKEGKTYRLPTEAEWEYACRAGTTTPFNVGKQLNDRDANSRQLLGRTTAVGSYKPNAFGLYDTHGNVWEWCTDWYGEDYYAHSPANDPQGPNSGSQHVFRGGSWLNLVADQCRSAIRLYGEPTQRSHCLGFRVLREWDERQATDSATTDAVREDVPTVRIVAYEGISSPARNGGSGYLLSPSSHQLVLNPYFGAARTVHKNDADYLVVQLLPSFKPVAEAFVKASPRIIVTYVKEIEGYHSKYLDHMSDPTMLHEVSIPVVKKETPTRVTVADSSSAALRSSFVFKAGEAVSIRLRYAGNAKNWDAGFEMQKESLVTSNSATIILTDSKGKSVAPRKDKILNLQYDQITARPFDVTIDLVKLYDISQVGVYKLEWGCKQVQTQVVDFEIKE